MVPFLAILLATVAWQGLYCRVATEGKITGLFYVGSGQPRPPEPRDRVFVYPNSAGYDGQIYRVIARDPLLREGHWKLIGSPRHWYRRILLPAAAAALGRGSPAAIDWWYVAIADLAIAFGGACFVRLASGLCRPAIAAGLWLANPSVVATTDRMVADGVLAALAMGAWWFYRTQRLAFLWVCLALLPLVRETGILIAPGVVLAYVLSREMKRAAIAALSVAPVLGWWGWLAAHTPPSQIGWQLGIPILPQAARMFQLRFRPLPPLANAAAQVFDALALAALLLAFGWIGWRTLRAAKETALVLPMALAVTFFSAPSLLGDPYDFMRYAGVPVAWATLQLLAVRPPYAGAYLAAASGWLLTFRGVALARAFIRLPL